MSGLSKIKKEVCVHGYESVWLNRWTRRGREFGLQARSSNRDVECSTKINGQLWKESTGSMKLEGKMLSGFLDLFPNPDSAVQRIEMIPDMNKEPPIVADRENSIDEEGESSSSATQTRNVKHFLNNNKSFKESKLIRLDHETNSISQFKRLKINSSDYSGNGTKGMMVVEEGPSQEKVNYFFNRILRCGISKSGSTRNQERFQSRIKNLKMGGGRRGEDEDFTLLHPWIQRWCKRKAAEIHEQGGGQEVNPTLEKQFPSIAAMALMGKALSLTPTGMKKTNSLFVWNAKELR